MVEKLSNALLLFIVITSIIILIYGIFLIIAINKKRLYGLPFPFGNIYNALSELAIVKFLLGYLQRCFYLIHVNQVKSEVLASIFVTIMPSVFILLFTFTNLFSPTWYLSAICLGICAIIPLYMLKSYVAKKCLVIRINLLKSFTSFTSLLSNGTIATASEDMIFSSHGPVKLIYKEFSRLYKMDKSSAYEFLKYVSGDSYSCGIADVIKQYDDEGEDPTDEINKMCKQGLQIFRLQLMGFRKFSDLKISSVIMFVASLGIRFLGNYLGNLMNFQYNEIIGYLCVVVTLLSFALCFIFESNC